MAHEIERFTTGRIRIGTVTLDEGDKPISPREGMFLDLMKDGAERGEIPGTLLVERRHSGASDYIAIEVQPNSPADTSIIERIKKGYNDAVTQWMNRDFPRNAGISIEAFRKKYLPIPIPA